LDGEYRYKAFISYSHADEEWAKWLHRALETYRVPKRLVGRESECGPVPARLSPVFRDRDELASATSLGDTLTRALQQSAFLVVICSRTAARSRWVNEEVLTFKRMGRERRILALLVDGDPGASSNPETAALECFPPALIHTLGPDGELTGERCEPIAADLRPGKDSRKDALLKIVAGILGVGLDELKQRDAHRRQVRMMWLVGASVAGMAITSSLAAVAWLARAEAERQRVRAEAEAETSRQTTRFLVDLFKVSDPGEALGNTITAREILDKGAARIEQELSAQPAIQATLMDTMGTVYTRLGLYTPALELVRQAYERRLALWGPEHPEVASSLAHLGVVQTLRSDYAEAEQRLREALEIRRTLFGDPSAEVADSLGALANLLQLKGDYAGSESLVREALKMRRSLYGAVHADVAESIESLGLNLYARGEYEAAVEHLREAVAMQKQLHGGPHPDLAQATANLGRTLMEQGQMDEAETLNREALAMMRQLYGEVHPETGSALNNLAYVLEQRGDLDGAESAYQESLAVTRELQGPNHPDVGIVLTNIAFVRFADGRLDEAMATMREALAGSRRALGDEHPEVASQATTLAYFLIEAGNFDEATPLLEEALETRRKLLGSEAPQVAGTLTTKANLMLATGRYAEARDLAREARQVLSHSLPDDAWPVAYAMNAEGAALTGLGEFAESEGLLLASQGSLGAAPIPGLAAKGRRRLVDLYTAWGKTRSGPIQRSEVGHAGAVPVGSSPVSSAIPRPPLRSGRAPAPDCCRPRQATTSAGRGLPRGTRRPSPGWKATSGRPRAPSRPRRSRPRLSPGSPR